MGREHFGTDPFQSSSLSGIRLYFVRPHFPSPNFELLLIFRSFRASRRSAPSYFHGQLQDSLTKSQADGGGGPPGRFSKKARRKKNVCTLQTHSHDRRQFVFLFQGHSSHNEKKKIYIRGP